jgi:IS30 family transposase
MERRAAREADARDRDRGRRPRNGPRLSTAARRAEVERLVAEGMTAAQIAFTLGVHYDTVRRDLGRKTTPA